MSCLLYLDNRHDREIEPVLLGGSISAETQEGDPASSTTMELVTPVCGSPSMTLSIDVEPDVENSETEVDMESDADKEIPRHAQSAPVVSQQSETETPKDSW